MDFIHCLIVDLLKDIHNPILVECGSRAGEDTQILINNFPSCSIHCFEPLPINFTQLIKNVKPPKDNVNGVKMNMLAVSDKIGEADFYCSDDKEHFRGSSSLNKPTGHLQVFEHVTFPETIKVKITTLDKYCVDNKISHVDYLWTDVQSHEKELILGAQNILKKTRYFQGEYYTNTGLYENQPSLNEWISLLPGSWKIIEQLPHDCILENLDFKG